jgi:hypothetical protein
VQHHAVEFFYYGRSRQGWRIKDWCAPDVKIISQALLFKLWRSGEGPRHVRIGGATVITESHKEYLDRLARESAEASG